jgi:hypothetical protein
MIAGGPVKTARGRSGPRAAAGITVVMLAGIAGAISYSHMRELAAAQGEAGWHGQTLPLSVDAIEIGAGAVHPVGGCAARRSAAGPRRAVRTGESGLGSGRWH